MAVEHSRIVLTFEHPRISREVQEQEGRRYFYECEPRVYHVGKLPEAAQEVAEASEPDDQIWLWSLAMVGAIHKKGGPISKNARVTLFCKAVAARKTVIIEGATGRTTGKRAEAVAMIDEAHGLLVRSGMRLPKSGAKPGQKEKTWPNAGVEAIALKLWQSKEIPSDAGKIRLIKSLWPGVGDRLIKRLGNPERK